MSDLRARILGTGYFVPPNLRTNDDPVFDWIRAHPPKGADLFTGYKTRAVLAPGEDLMTMMVPAALHALDAAGLKAADVDLLLGHASVSPFSTPNELSHLHRMLQLPQRAYTVALNNEFSNFNAGLLFADALIRAGRAKNVLIVVGGNWSRHVDYHTAQSVSAADGAGAAVMGPSSDQAQWRVIDHSTIMDTIYFGSMYMQGQRYEQQPARDRNEWLWSDPFFQITEKGMEGFGKFGGQAATAAVTQLLAAHRVPDSEWTLIAHQASSVLLDIWKKSLKPGQTIDTIEQFANMTIANIAVNLAWSVKNDPIRFDRLVLFALAPDMHAHALLLQRNSL